MGAYAGCLSDDIGRVSAWGPGRSSVRGTMKGIRPEADEECTFGDLCRISSRRQIQDDRPGADVIDLREIHLARQSSLQVPVGHIVVPGGIKLCSPGTPIFITGTCRAHRGGLLLWRPVELALLPEFALNVEQVVSAE